MPTVNGSRNSCVPPLSWTGAEQGEERHGYRGAERRDPVLEELAATL